ncbi:MAG: [Bacteroidales bacterium]|nr:[citrate (pro-3S)-lyase] ligase [Bacteroidales bacterium]
MMDIYEEKQIQELPLSVPLFRKKVEDFLKTNGLRLEKVDLYMAIQDADEQILAGGGLAGDTIKCIAVSEKARSEGLAAPLISRLIAIGAERGYSNIKVFTKPENRAIFESLGFRLLASASKAILLENGNGLREYLQSLGCLDFARHDSGVILMNANPFTLGHRYLIEKALEQVGHLYVIVVREDVSRFPYAERLATVKAACAGLQNVTVCEGSSYQISAATFPTYFLKELTDASETQMRLDLDLFCRHIAPALGATVRFVGTEPTDALTARYNALMKEILPSHGIRLVEIPR